MTQTNKTRLAKRKLEITGVRKEKQTMTSKKHDKDCFATLNDVSKDENIAASAPKTSNKTKVALLEEMHLMKQLNDALLEEVKENEEKIANLNKKEQKFLAVIKDLKEKSLKQNHAENSQKETQTLVGLDDRLFIPCNICIYMATCEEELNWHLNDAHAKDDQLNYETDFPCEDCGRWCQSEDELRAHMKIHATLLKCRFCEKSFETKNDLMKHSKIYHEKQTSVCNNFEIEVCDYEEKDCWFLHRKSLLTKLNCTKCEKTFKGRSEFFIHRKHDHPELVKRCKNEERCKYEV